jgi:hypothetical protein
MISRLGAGMGAVMQGYINGQAIAMASEKANRERAIKDEIAAVDQNFTPTQTESASGEDALQAAQRAKDQAQATAADDAQRQKIESDFQPTISALEANRATPASIIRSIGIGQDFRQQAEPFSENEVRSAKAGARADVYSRHGREEDAARVMRNEASRRTLADDTELRRVMDPGAPTGTPGGQAIDLADVTASNTIPSRTRIIATQGVDEPIQRGHDRNAADAYFQRKAPAVIDALLKQGKLDEAKRYRDFIDSEQGRAYAEKWSRGVRKFAIGDHQGALNDWEGLYNQQLYDDGYTVKLSPLEDGKQVRADFFDNSGKQIRTFTQPIDALARQAGMALAPEKLVEMRARQEEARTKEEASLDKAIKLETLRQQGQEVREDRRDERLGMRLDAQGKQLERRLAAGGRLTQAQQRSNFEIDAAREMVAGLSDEDIRQRTATTTATGRENPLFDPALSRAAKLAGRRKIGDDEAFDARTGRQPAAQPAAGGKPAGGDDIAKRFRANRQFDNYKLGKSANVTTKDGRQVQGVEVLDKHGKVIGYFE